MQDHYVTTITSTAILEGLVPGDETAHSMMTRLVDKPRTPDAVTGAALPLTHGRFAD